MVVQGHQSRMQALVWWQKHACGSRHSLPTRCLMTVLSSKCCMWQDALSGPQRLQPRVGMLQAAALPQLGRPDIWQCKWQHAVSRLHRAVS